MFETELRLIREYLGKHPAEAAVRLAELSATDAAGILADQPGDLGSQILERMPPIAAGERLCRMPPESASALLCRLGPSQATSLLRRLPIDARHAIVAVTPENWSKAWGKALSYREGTAGALMDTAPQTVSADLTIAEALTDIQRQSGRLYTELFVVDADTMVLGALPLSSLLREPADESVRHTMHPIRFTVGPSERPADLRRKPALFDLDVIPVTDSERKLLGVLPTRRLRQTARRSMADGSGVSAVVTLSEVCWSGMAGAIDGLISIGSGPGESRRRS